MWAPLRIEKERDFLCSLISSGKEVRDGVIVLIRETSRHLGDVPQGKWQ